MYQYVGRHFDKATTLSGRSSLETNTPHRNEVERPIMFDHIDSAESFLLNCAIRNVTEIDTNI